MKGTRSLVLLPFISLFLSLSLQSGLYGQAKEYTPLHTTSADAPPTFLETRNVPHGTLRAEVYSSKVLGVTWPLLVYAPPGYDTDSKQTYPVLFLYHGYGDTVYYWVTEGRVQQIPDNAIADGRAVPMVVVIPDTHALDLDKSTRT
jgi:enterochelin esterase-like enzyme